MSKYTCKWVKHGIGDPSSKYAFDHDGKQFDEDIQRHNRFRGLFRKYYDEFIGD